MNYKEHDRQRILSYLEAHPSCTVKAIIEESGAERLRVYPLLFELSQENRIQIVEESEWGAPIRLKMKSQNIWKFLQTTWTKAT